MGCAKGTEHGQKRGRAEARRSVSTFPIGAEHGLLSAIKAFQPLTKDHILQGSDLGEEKKKNTE